MAIEVGSAFVTIIPSAKGFARGLQSELAGEFRSALGIIPEEGERAGRTFSERFKGSVSRGLSGLGSILRTGAATATVGLLAGLGALTGFGLKTAATLEQTQISFNALTGSVEKGQKVFQDLQKFAAVTPFQFTDLTRSAGRFLAFADSVKISRDQLIPFLTTVGNVVSVTGGTAENLDSVSLALGQIASRGKVTLDNINQLSNALPGFSGVAALAAARGETTAQVMDEITAGTINAEDGVKQLLIGMQKFPGAAGAMEKQSQTLLGVFSTFKDTIGQALSNAFTPVIPAIKDSIAQITPILGEAVNTLAPALGGLLASLLPVVSQLVSALVPILTPLINALGPALAAIGPSLAPLGAALGQIATVLAPLLPLLGETIGALAQALSPIIQALAPVINGLIFGLTQALEPLLPILVQVGKVIGDALLPVSQVLGQVFVALGPAIGQIVAALGTALTPLLEVLGPVVGQLVNALLPMLPAITALAPPIAELIIALTPLIELLAQLLVIGVDILTPIIQLTGVLVSLLASKAVAPLLSLIAEALAAILTPLLKLIGPLEDFDGFLKGINWATVGKAILSGLGTAITAVGDFFVGLGKTIGHAFVVAFDAVVGFFQALPGRIVDGLKALPGLLVASAKNAFHAFFFAIGFAIGTIIKLVVGTPLIIGRLLVEGWKLSVRVTVEAFERIVSFFRALPGRIGALVTALWRDSVARFKAGLALVVAVVKGIPGFFSRLWAEVKSRFITGIATAITVAKELPGKLVEIAKETITKVKDTFAGLASALFDIGVNIIKSLSGGIKSAVSGAVDAAKSAVGDIIDGAKSALGIGSPSKVFGDMGENTMRSYADQVDKHADLAAKAVANALTPSPADLAKLAEASSLATLEPMTRATQYNLTAARATITREDLKALVDRDEALNRQGRPR